MLASGEKKKTYVNVCCGKEETGNVIPDYSNLEALVLKHFLDRNHFIGSQDLCLKYDTKTTVTNHLHMS
jgi:hypothetical protein